jgi:hypothetical protein
MNNVILALEVMGKIISGMFFTPEALSVLILFGALFTAFAIKIKLEQE